MIAPRIWIDRTEIDCNELNFTFNISAFDFNDIEKIKSSMSTNIMIPATKTNSLIFNLVDSNGFLPNVEKTIIIEVGAFQFKGYVRNLRVTRTDEQDFINFQAITDNGAFLTALEGKTLREISSLDANNHDYTSSNINTYESTDGNINYPLISFGQFGQTYLDGGYTYSSVKVEERVAAIKLIHILNGIFSELAGYTLSSTFLNDTFFSKIYGCFPSLWKNDYDATKLSCKVTKTANQTLIVDSTFLDKYINFGEDATSGYYNTQQTDNVGAPYWKKAAPSGYMLPAKCKFRLTARINATILRASNPTANNSGVIEICLYDEVLGNVSLGYIYRKEPLKSDIAPYFSSFEGVHNTTFDYTMTWSGMVDGAASNWIQKEWSSRIRIGVIRTSSDNFNLQINTISWVKIDLVDVDNNLYKGMPLQIRTYLRDVPCIDFLKACFHPFNIKIATNSQEKIIYAEPLNTFYYSSGALDFSDKIDTSRGIEIYDIEAKKQYRLKYKTDDKDKYSELYQVRIAKQPNKSLGEHVEVLTRVDVTDTESIENILFAPTISAVDPQLQIKSYQLPRCWSEYETVPAWSLNFEPRILIREDPFTGIRWKFDGSFRTTAPDLSMFNLYNGQGLNFDDKNNKDGLNATYWQQYFNILNQQLNTDKVLVRMEAYFNLSDAEMSAYVNSDKIRYPIYIGDNKYNGYWYIESIEKYAPGTGLPVLIKLIRAIDKQISR